MNALRWLGKISLTLLAYLGLQQLTEQITHGFSPTRIQTQDLSFQSDWEIPPPSSPAQECLAHLLDQSFHMMGAGSECFAFLGDDHQTVIKFFKLDQVRPVYLYRGLFREDYSAYAHTLFPCPSFLHPWSDRLVGIRAFRINRTFTSFLIAYHELQEQTGLLYLHLNPTTTWHKTLTIYDGCGIAHQIDLDKTHFILQKKVTPLFSHFKRLLSQGKQQEAQTCIDSLLTLLFDRCQKGIADRDIVCRNFGFLDDRAIELDAGSFSLMPEMKQRWLYRQEILYATLELKLWLETQAPQLATYLQTRVEEMVL